MDLLFSWLCRSSIKITDLQSEIIKHHILSIFKRNKRDLEKGKRKKIKGFIHKQS